MSSTDRHLRSSFRDPSGFIYSQDGRIFRQINKSYQSQYERLVGSGLYSRLVERGLLIPHEEATDKNADAYKTISPELVPFISYPYEWCLSQLRDAAIATLDIMSEALAEGMILKDASAYNIQFCKGKPLLIDTLSFDHYEEGKPWVAYGQFCRHFVAPLVLMAHTDIRLNKLSRLYIDGLPLDLASKLAPRRTKWNIHIASHLHIHGKSVAHAGAPSAPKPLTRRGLEAILDSLRTLVLNVRWKDQPSTWGNYYENTNYSDKSMQTKLGLVDSLLDACQPVNGTVWDLGANTGRFSELASKRGWHTVAWDLDASAVEQCYAHVKETGDKNLLPLVQDLTNPSPGIGWAHHERDSLAERGPAEVIMALALIHHLAIGNNVPLPDVAAYMAKVGKKLIIEFVPKEDSQVQRLLSTREDVFGGYCQEAFESAFAAAFEIEKRVPIEGSSRVLYLMQRREG